MSGQDHITVSFPKGIERGDLAIIVIFGIVMYFLWQALQSVITSGSKNPNFALVVIVFILLVICFLFVYVTRIIKGRKTE